MGNIRIDIANVVTISLVAFVGIWAINRGLKRAGLSQFAVS